MAITSEQFASNLALLIEQRLADTITPSAFNAALADLVINAGGVFMPGKLALRLQDLFGNEAVRQSELRNWWAGTSNGGPNGNGLYPFTNDLGVITFAPSPAKIEATLAGLNPLGALDSVDDLPPEAAPGDFYTIDGVAWAYGSGGWVSLDQFQGPAGPTPIIAIGTVEAVPVGTPAAVTLGAGSTPEAPVLDFDLPLSPIDIEGVPNAALKTKGDAAGLATDEALEDLAVDVAAALAQEVADLELVTQTFGARTVSMPAVAKIIKTFHASDAGCAMDRVTDDTGNLQDAMSDAFGKGRRLILDGIARVTAPPGQAAITISQADVDPVNGGRRGSVVGWGAGASGIKSDHAGPALSYTGGPGEAAHAYQSMRDFMIQGPGHAVAGSSLLRVDNAAYAVFSSLYLFGAETGFDGTDVLTATLLGCQINSCGTNILLRRGDFSHPNAVTLLGGSVASAQVHGINLTGAGSFTMVGTAVEGNGRANANAGGFGGGLLAYNSADESSIGVTALGCYFEGNKGVADIHIEEAVAGRSLAHTFVGNSFKRYIAAQHTKYNIYAGLTAGTRTEIHLKGNSFTRGSDYVESASRPYLTGSEAAIFMGLEDNFFESDEARPDRLLALPAALPEYPTAGLPAVARRRRGATVMLTGTDSGTVRAWWDGTNYRRAVDDVVVT